MPYQYKCPNCGKTYLPNEIGKSMFCPNPKCGAYGIKGVANQIVYYPPDQKPNARQISSCEHTFDEYKPMLSKAHKLCSNIIKKAGFTPEPLKTALTSESYRWFWKPKKVRFLVVGESHVYTNRKENKAKMLLDRLPEKYPRDSPLDFVKLVYCLGYGEPYVIDKPQNIENNAGTKQYFDLFRSWVRPFLKQNGNSSLELKLEILKTIQAKGIWLLDASCHACAMGKNERLPSRIVDRIIPISWSDYVKPIIDDLSIDPKNVWIIGKGLHDILSGEYVRASNWIYQPNVRFSDSQKYTEKNQREETLIKEIRKVCKATG